MCPAERRTPRLAWVVAGSVTLLALPGGVALARDAEVVDLPYPRAANCIPEGYQREWEGMREDDLHDPESAAVATLQQPAEALGRLPPDTAGNLVDWIEAIRSGAIHPRATRRKDGATVETRDTNVLMRGTGSAAYVLFPHAPHTEWLDCANCHSDMFAKEAGATQFSMLDILQGRYCGRCHGAVSFPLTECRRCHNVSPSTEKPIRFCPEALP